MKDPTTVPRTEPDSALELTARERRRGWFVVAAFFAMVVYLVVSHHQPSAAFIGCPFRWATGYSCFGCGMTRSTAHFLHADLIESVRHHPFGPLFVIGFAVAALNALVQNLRGEKLTSRVHDFWRRASKPAWAVMALLVVGFGLVRFALEVSGFLTPI